MCSLVLVFLVSASWSIASPLFGAPDEPDHIARAVAIVHGELTGTPNKTLNAVTTVTIPAVYAHPNSPCFAFHSERPASCQHLTSSTREVRMTMFVGRYPPLYYTIVGLPSLFTSSITGIYLMRLMSALLCSLFYALSIMVIATWSRRRLLFVGMMTAMTPEATFLSGVVNPSGFEIAAACCLWCSLLVLVLEHGKDPPKGLVVIAGVSASTFVLIRGLSPLWCALIFLIALLLGNARDLVGLVRARRDVRIALGAIVFFAIVASIWIVVEHANTLTPGQPVPPGTSGASLLAIVIGNTGRWIHQMVGVFGWLDTIAPLPVFLAWYFAVGFLVIAVVILAKRRQTWILGLVILIVFVLPVVLSYSQAARLGVVGQGRYTLPFAIGIPLISCSIIGASTALSAQRVRLARALCFLLGIADVLAFAQALRRYTVGANGPLDFFSGKWSPPIGTLAITIVFVVSITLLIKLFTILLSGARSTMEISELSTQHLGHYRVAPTRIVNGHRSVNGHRPASLAPGVGGKQLDKGANGKGGGTLGEITRRLRRTSGTRDVEMHPGDFADKALK
jgi:hypothetical protein